MARREVEAIEAPNFNDAAAMRAMERELKQIERMWVKALEDTTKTWDDKPTFKVDMRRRGNQYTVRARVSDMRWIWIDEGTKRHYIAPKRPGGVLRFPSMFSPKSRPNTLRSYRGMSGPPMVYAKQVDHPGITPRNWSKMLSRRLTPRFRDTVSDAFVAYANASGHAAD